MSRPSRLIPLVAVAAAVAACGSTAGSGESSGATDHLAGKPAAQLVKDAQSWLRGAHYHFRDTLAQASTASDLSGVPQEMLPSLTGSITLSAEGDVDGGKHISAEAFVAGVTQPIHLVEYGCTGYASLDGSTWFKGSQPRWLTRMVAPSFDDGLTALAWHDLGPATRGNVAVHHLRATMTALGMSGAAPPPGATPPPGFDVKPTTMDLWVRSADGSALEMDGDVDATADVHALAASGPPALRNAAGTLHQTLHQTVTFSAPRGSVQAPTATLGSDPVPDSVYSGFGSFGVQTDDCGNS